MPHRERHDYLVDLPVGFTLGINRQLARDLLFRFGLITSSEMLEELHGQIATDVASPDRGRSNTELADRIRDPNAFVWNSAEDPEALSLIAARGALYGARLEAMLRTRSQGRKGLVDLIRRMLDRAKVSEGQVDADAWLE